MGDTCSVRGSGERKSAKRISKQTLNGQDHQLSLGTDERMMWMWILLMHCVRAWEVGECGSYLQLRIRQWRGIVVNVVMNVLYYIKCGEMFKQQHSASQESLYFMELVKIYVQ